MTERDRNESRIFNEFLGKLASCSVCRKPYIGLKLLPNCQHAVCVECLETRIKTRYQNKDQAGPSCPVCEAPLWHSIGGEIKDLPTDDYFLRISKDTNNYRTTQANAPVTAEGDVRSTLDKRVWPPVETAVELQQCHLCRRDGQTVPEADISGSGDVNSSQVAVAATACCLECRQLICNECVVIHNRMRITCGHSVKKLDDIFRSRSDRKSYKLKDVVAALNAKLADMKRYLDRMETTKAQVDAECRRIKQVADDDCKSLIEQLNKSIRNGSHNLRMVSCFIQYCQRVQDNGESEIIDLLIRENVNGACLIPVDESAKLLDVIFVPSNCSALPYVSGSLVGKLHQNDGTSEREVVEARKWLDDRAFGQVDSYKRRLDDANKRIENLERNLSDKTQQLEQANNRIRELRETIQTTVQQYANEIGKHSEVNSHLHDLLFATSESAKQSIDQQQSKIEALEMTVKEANSYTGELQHRLTSTLTQLENVDGDRKETRRQLEHATQENANLRSQLMELDKRLLESQRQERALKLSHSRNSTREMELVEALRRTEERWNNCRNELDEVLVKNRVYERQVTELLTPLSVAGVVPVRGVTTYNGKLYIARSSSCNLEVYNCRTLRLQAVITVKHLLEACDVTSCTVKKCLYVASCDGSSSGSIHRIDVTSPSTQNRWEIENKPQSLSVTPDHHYLLVTLSDIDKLELYTGEGQLLRQFRLDQQVTAEVSGLQHVVQLANGLFVAAFGSSAIFASRGVCQMKAEQDGNLKILAKAPTCPEKENDRLLCRPIYLAVDERKCRLYVVDSRQREVSVLELKSMRFIDSIKPFEDDLDGIPYLQSLSLSESGKYLYVADSSGHVTLFNSEMTSSK